MKQKLLFHDAVIPKSESSNPWGRVYQVRVKGFLPEAHKFGRTIFPVEKRNKEHPRTGLPAKYITCGPGGHGLLYYGPRYEFVEETLLRHFKPFRIPGAGTEWHDVKKFLSCIDPFEIFRDHRKWAVVRNILMFRVARNACYELNMVSLGSPYSKWEAAYRINGYHEKIMYGAAITPEFLDF